MIEFKDDVFYEIAEVRTITGRSTKSINAEIRAGRLRASNTGPERYVKGAWLRQWLEGTHAEATPTTPSIEPAAACPPTTFGTHNGAEMSASAV